MTTGAISRAQLQLNRHCEQLQYKNQRYYAHGDHFPVHNKFADFSRYFELHLCCWTSIYAARNITDTNRNTKSSINSTLYVNVL